tara:strand:+ start:291 stop:815 length:525 start_codon:yes stop_codon:yes gene_type:complete
MLENSFNYLIKSNALKKKGKHANYVLTNTFFMGLKRFYSLSFLGKLLLSAIFVNAIPHKITDFGADVQKIVDRGFPESISIIMLAAAIFLLLSGSFLLIFSERTKLACSLLLIFLIPTTIIFHLLPFELWPLARNLSLIGGLIIAIDKSKFDSLNKDSRIASNEIEYSDLNEDN